jgi:hypothetical protein
MKLLDNLLLLQQKNNYVYSNSFVYNRQRSHEVTEQQLIFLQQQVEFQKIRNCS